MDRLIRVEIENFRSIEKVTFELDAFQVLIGENGGGKSSLIECFELLRKTAAPQFVQEIERVHGGSRAMVRHGESMCQLRAFLALDGGLTARYSVSFGAQPGWGSTVHFETLEVEGEHSALRTLIRRANGQNIGKGPNEPDLEPPNNQQELGLPFVRTNPVADRVCRVFEGIDVHLGHEVGALWRQRERSRSGSSGGLTGSLREPSQLSPGRRLERGATNLASVFHSLKNDAPRSEWDHTLRLVQLGLGEDVDDVSVQIVAESGYGSLSLRYRDGRVVSAMAASDGQLAYLAFVALVRSATARTVLLVDEPELHLHPGLVVRVLDLLDSAAMQAPVIIATHSNDLIDALERPEDLRVVSTSHGKTQVEAVQTEALERWRHRSLSSVRRAMGDRELSTP